MFRIGEFAQIAQVSTRRLRFYDEIGLLRPAHADQRSGYRYYSIRQLPRLNAILALQDLGLMLDQIGPLLDDAVSPAELRGMLLLKRATAEQAMRIEEQRLRHIESRIAQIDRQGKMSDYDVVTKTLPILAADYMIDDLEEAGPLVAAAAAAGRLAIPETRRGNLIVIAENEVGFGRMNLSVGYTLSRAASRELTAAGLTFNPRTLPSIETAATLVRQGTNAESHTAFGTIGLWVEANGHVVTGPSREIFLEPVLEPPGFDRALVEIQFPIALA